MYTIYRNGKYTGHLVKAFSQQEAIYKAFILYGWPVNNLTAV